MNKPAPADKEKPNNLIAFFKKALIIIASSCVYALLFFLTYTNIKMGIVANLSLIPIIFVALWWGRLAGLSMFLVNQIWTSIIIRTVAPGSTIWAPEPIMAFLTFIFTAIVMGTVGNLTKKLKAEVAERKVIEQQLKNYQDKLEELIRQKTEELDNAYKRMVHVEKMKAIGQLAGGVAHDFNNQLTIIIGYCDLLKIALKDRPDLLEYVEYINASGKRSADLTKQLLAFARKGKYKAQTININELISEIMVLLSRTIGEKIIITRDLTASDSYVWGEPTQIHTAMINLILNARDAMEQGGELIVRTENEEVEPDFCNQYNLELKAGPYVSVSVIDNGTGIEDKHMQHIFEPFYTTKEEGKGTGMGLAAVYGIMKTHNGGILAQSQAGKGSTFKLYFPRMQPPCLTLETGKENPIPAMQKSSHILIVDDEKDVAIVIKDILERLGYKITVMTSCQEAIDFYANTWKEIDLILLDMIMPGMNGRELFNVFKKINPLTKAILASGYGMTRDVKKILQEGVLSFIQKPYTIEELAQQIQKALNDESAAASSLPVKKKSAS